MCTFLARRGEELAEGLEALLVRGRVLRQRRQQLHHALVHDPRSQHLQEKLTIS